MSLHETRREYDIIESQFRSGPMNIRHHMVLSTITELIEEYNYISHVHDKVLVWRWGRGMATRGEEPRTAIFTAAGELVRYTSTCCHIKELLAL